MNSQKATSLEKIRQQFDTAPYPTIPLERSPKEDIHTLYTHDLTTSHYVRNQRVLNPNDKLILDAGCGSGYKSLVLAEANPGAKIIGVDLSVESIKLAEQRLTFHGFENFQFHALTIDELPTLGLEFDYINCDEVLYLLPDPVAGLQAMKSVLKPDGIIRANFHDRLQRSIYYQAQEFFRLMGLMESSSARDELAAVRTLMKALKDGVMIKARTWGAIHETDDERVLVNHLLRGDKGVTIPEFFAILKAANLEFISMVNWWQWDLTELFADFSDLPLSIGLTFAEKNIEEQLHIFELLHAQHRLLDLWCGHPNAAQPYTHISEWTDQQWHQATVYLLPQLKIDSFKKALIDCITESRLFEISGFLQKTNHPIHVDNVLASCLLLLQESPQTIADLARHWKQLRPIHFITFQPTTDAEAFELIKQRFTELEAQGYVLLETSI
jgi:ubiquinone/menaquinone biosynthesis C-methylase UbiE